MAANHRVAQYIQRVAYESLLRDTERDERPQDAPQGPEPTPSYSSWSATSFSAYVPFSGPTNG